METNTPTHTPLGKPSHLTPASGRITTGHGNREGGGLNDLFNLGSLRTKEMSDVSSLLPRDPPPPSPALTLSIELLRTGIMRIPVHAGAEGHL
ncbi:hypothetical protein CEXT_73321 [Caerostris extrusa]|uniref:Uncharacterized protein n=1 Tax=Caerostris extrusa TaxID=172846 RepID=A0AAV4XHI6_CAEEX|nr:hypothetical protein CEXT_73321 [Caerostris extrusa]